MKLRESWAAHQYVSLYNNLPIKFLADRCRFLSGRVRSWCHFLRLCCMSDFGGNSTSSKWCVQCWTFQNNRSSASLTSSSAVSSHHRLPQTRLSSSMKECLDALAVSRCRKVYHARAARVLVSFEMTTDWKTCRRSGAYMPCKRRMLRPYMDRTHELMQASVNFIIFRQQKQWDADNIDN